jgi:hypothetical protein
MDFGFNFVAWNQMVFECFWCLLSTQVAFFSQKTAKHVPRQATSIWALVQPSGSESCSAGMLTWCVQSHIWPPRSKIWCCSHSGNALGYQCAQCWNKISDWHWCQLDVSSIKSQIQASDRAVICVFRPVRCFQQSLGYNAGNPKDIMWGFPKMEVPPNHSSH